MSGTKPRHNRGSLWPPASSKGAIVVYDHRGQLVAQKWPRKRGTPTHPNIVHWNEWFKQANSLAKYAPARFQQAAQEATKNSALMPRDVMLMAMRGRLFIIELEGGEVIYPVAGRNDVSTALDLLGKQRGSILYRNQELWVPLPPGNPGQALVVGDNFQPTWGAGGGGGKTPYTPPTTAILDEWYHEADTQAIDSAYDAMVLYRINSGLQSRYTGRFHNYGPGLRTYTAGFSAGNHGLTEFHFGIAAWSKTEDVILAWGTRYVSSNLQPNQTAFVINRNGSILTNASNAGFRPSDPCFYQIRNNGSACELLWGTQPDAMLHVASVGFGTTFGEPTHYGVFLGWGSTSGLRGPQHMSIIHWDATDNP